MKDQRLKEKAWNVLFEYSRKSTIAGLHYAFETKNSSSNVGNIGWMVLILILTFLGVYVSIQVLILDLCVVLRKNFMTMTKEYYASIRTSLFAVLVLENRKITINNMGKLTMAL
jgi:hypothetical protein